MDTAQPCITSTINPRTIQINSQSFTLANFRAHSLKIDQHIIRLNSNSITSPALTGENQIPSPVSTYINNNYTDTTTPDNINRNCDDIFTDDDDVVVNMNNINNINNVDNIETNDVDSDNDTYNINANSTMEKNYVNQLQNINNITNDSSNIASTEYTIENDDCTEINEISTPVTRSKNSNHESGGLTRSENSWRPSIEKGRIVLEMISDILQQKEEIEVNYIELKKKYELLAEDKLQLEKENKILSNSRKELEECLKVVSTVVLQQFNKHS